jgi:hypothetical protein
MPRLQLGVGDSSYRSVSVCLLELIVFFLYFVPPFFLLLLLFFHLGLDCERLSFISFPKTGWTLWAF